MKFKELIKSIDKDEWHLVILVIFGLVILTSLPYVVGYLNTPSGYYFRGTHSITPGDIFVYYSYINQIKEGNISLFNYFTSEPQAAGLLNLFWLPVGLMARFLYLTPFVAFQLVRIFLIPFFIIIAYVFLGYFLTQKKQRKLAFIFLCFSSGVGAFFAEAFTKVYPADFIGQIYNWPIDLWVSEANIFLSLSQTPHFIISLILLLIFILSLLLAVENNNFFYSLFSGLCGLYWFNFHPYYFPYVFIIFGVYFLAMSIKNKKFYYWQHYFVAFILSLPFIIYHYYEITIDWAIGMRASQNICLTPSLIFVIIGFGFLLICGLIGFGLLLKKKILLKDNKWLFLAIWLLSGLVLIYFPFNFQRRFLMGLQIPLVIFTIFFLCAFYSYLKNKLGEKKIHNYNLIFGFIIIILFGFSTLFNISRDLYYCFYQNKAFYLPNEYKAIASWLDVNNTSNKVILSSEISGYIIPSLINQQVYLGHGHETINYNIKEKQVAAFLNNKLSDEDLQKYIQSNNIGYFIYTPLEKYFSSYQPEKKDYLEKVFETGGYSIYALKNF